METIETKDMDAKFKFEVAARPGGENVKLCFQCGTCTATCPVSQIDDEFNPRKIIRQVVLGMRKEVLTSPVIWRCVQCYACVAKCPQNVKFADVMATLRQMAVEEGHVPPTMVQDVDELGRFAQTLRRNLVNTLVKDRGAYESKRAALEAAIQT